MTGQLVRTRSLLRKLSGQDVCLMRPPGGFTTNVLASTRPLGLTAVLWSTDTLDWQQPSRRTDRATDRIVARATRISGNRHPVVLLHSGRTKAGAVMFRGNTIAALPRIIAWYRAHGYRFVTLDGRS